jgi:hypothetical protein
MKPMSWETAEVLRWYTSGDFSFVHDFDEECLTARLHHGGEFGPEVKITSTWRNQ